MPVTQNRLMTVEEFRRLPEGGPVSFELRHGELVEATRPNFRHHRTQERFVELLQAASAGIGHVSWEVAFRALRNMS